MWDGDDEGRSFNKAQAGSVCGYFIKNVKQLERSRYKDDTVRFFFFFVKWGNISWKSNDNVGWRSEGETSPTCRGICSRRCLRWAPEESTPPLETDATESPRGPPPPWGRATNFRPRASLYRSRTIYGLWSARPAARGSRKRLAIPSAAWISANVSLNPFIARVHRTLPESTYVIKKKKKLYNYITF